jgi:hypothetical protein
MCLPRRALELPVALLACSPIRFTLGDINDETPVNHFATRFEELGWSLVRFCDWLARPGDRRAPEVIPVWYCAACRHALLANFWLTPQDL